MQPDARGAEGDAKGLVPPAAPEADHAFVEHAGGKAAVDAGVVPQLGAGAEDAGAEDEVGKELPEGHDEVDGDQQGGEADEAAVEE